MATRRATTTAPPEDTGGDPPEPTTAEPTAAPAPDKAAIREVVTELLESMGITDDGGDPPEPAMKPGGTRTQAAVEADVESQVRKAIEKLRGEEDAGRETLQPPEPPEPERPPTKDRLSRRVMGWKTRA